MNRRLLGTALLASSLACHSSGGDAAPSDAGSLDVTRALPPITQPSGTKVEILDGNVAPVVVDLDGAAKIAPNCCKITFAVGEPSDALTSGTKVTLLGGAPPLSNGVALKYVSGAWTGTACVPPDYDSFYYYQFSTPEADAAPLLTKAINPAAPSYVDVTYGLVNSFQAGNSCGALEAGIYADLDATLPIVDANVGDVQFPYFDAGDGATLDAKGDAGCASIPHCGTQTCADATGTCTSCAAGFYLQGNACVACSTSCAAGSYETAACSPSADVTCAHCTSIPSCATETCTTASNQACTSCTSGGTPGDTGDCGGCGVACGGTCTSNVCSIHSATFAYTGAAVAWTPPAGVTLTIKMWGAGGSNSGYAGNHSAEGGGGGGGYATASLASTGQPLSISVGQGAVTSGANGPFFGGGGMSAGCGPNGGGGGRSEVQLSDGTVVLLAGGGGGGGPGQMGYGGPGGGGGGGGTSPAIGGGGGTSTSGNAPLIGQDGSDDGGGGGGGWYGGFAGSGDGCNDGGGGGGGSSYYAATLTTNALLVAATYSVPGNNTDPANNGAGNGGTADSQAGSNGLVVITW